MLVVTGLATIIADPSSDEPIIEANGSAAVVTATAAFSGPIHVGGISLTDGATAFISSLGAARSDTNYRVLILGMLNEGVAPQFAISGGSRLDLADNDMIAYDGSLASITSMVGAGYHGGSWNGTGIASTVAGGDTTHLSALGVVPNTLDGSTNSYSTFDGVALNSNTVVVKYTYYGDSNIDGQIDGSDYSLIDNGFNKQLTGWLNGDYNYDGIVDGSDYTLIDNAFNTQGASLMAQASADISSRCRPSASVFSSQPVTTASFLCADTDKRRHSVDEIVR